MLNRHEAKNAKDPILGGVEIKQGILTVPDTPGIDARPDPTSKEGLEGAS